MDVAVTKRVAAICLQVRELIRVCRRRRAESFGGSHLKLVGDRVMRPHSSTRRAVFPIFLTLASCAPDAAPLSHLRILAHDYAFEFPTTISPGSTAFRLVNQGTVLHEVQLYRFRQGISRDSALRMLATDQIPDSAVDRDGGVLIAGPADSTVQELLAPLRHGDVYALECAFRNAPGQPKHRDLGMVAVFEVK